MKHLIILLIIMLISACSATPTEKPVEQELFSKPRLCEPNNIFLIPKTDLPRLEFEIPENPTKEDLAAIILLQQAWIKEARKALYGF